MLHHEHLHQLLHQAGLWCRVLLQQSFLETFHHEFSFHCSHGKELVTLKHSLNCLGLCWSSFLASAWFSWASSWTSLQASSKIFFASKWLPCWSWQLPISRLVVFHFVSRIHRQACHFCTSCGSLWILKNLTNFASFSKKRRCEDDNRDDSVFRCEIELKKKIFLA